MHKSSSNPVNEGGHDTVARWLGCTLVSNEVSLYSQHIKVTKSIRVDLLPRDFNILCQSLTKKNQLYYTTIDSGIIPHQNVAQRDYLLGIVTSGILDTTEVIAKANSTKQSVNW